MVYSASSVPENGCNKTMLVFRFYLLIVHAASNRRGRGAARGEAAGQILLLSNQTLSSPPSSLPSISSHTMFSQRGEKIKLMHLMRPLLSVNFLSDSGNTMCIVLPAITCALSSKQMTLNNSSPYEGHEEAHEQN